MPIITYFLKVHFNIAFHVPLGLRSGPNSAGYISHLSARVLDALFTMFYIPVNTHCTDGGVSIIVLEEKRSQRVDTDVNLRLKFIQIK